MPTDKKHIEKESAMSRFGRFCEFSGDGCPCTVGSEEAFVLFTNVWNEEPHIKPHFDRVKEQPFAPALWVWLDDGSTDESYERMVEAKDDYPIEVIIIRNRKSMKRLTGASRLRTGAGRNLASIAASTAAPSARPNAGKPPATATTAENAAAATIRARGSTPSRNEG